MYLTRYPFRSFNFPDPKARNLYLDVNFSPPSFVPRVSNGLLLSFPVFQRLISYQREREEELSFCYLFSSRRFSRQKIIRDLILNFFLPPSSFDRICIGGDNCEQQESRGYSKTWHTRGGGREASRRMVARSFDSNLFTFASLVHGTACRALWTTPDAAIDFVLAHEPAQHTPFAATPLHE